MHNIIDCYRGVVEQSLKVTGGSERPKSRESRTQVGDVENAALVR